MGVGQFLRPLPSGCWVELDESLHATVYFIKGKPLPVRPPKISSQQEQRISHFTRQHGKSLKCFQDRGNLFKLQMGSAFPRVCYPVQKTQEQPRRQPATRSEQTALGPE